MVLHMRTRLVHGPAVKAIRESLGLKHGVFAVKCGISPGYLTNIEKGAKQPSPSVTVAIATQLGRTVDDFTYVVTSEAVAAKGGRAA